MPLRMRRNDLNFFVNKDIPIKCAANAPIDEKATNAATRRRRKNIPELRLMSHACADGLSVCKTTPR